MRAFASLALLAIVISAAACFSPTEPVCSYSCGPDGECPHDYDCRTDNYCHRSDTPQGTACEYSDASAPDTAVTTEPDLGPDGGVGDASSGPLSPDAL